MRHKILIVDDEPQILQGYQRILRKHFVVDIASGGQQALNAISSHGPYAVVVSDMRMPGMSGLELLMDIRKIAPTTVRIMLTGNADQQTAMDAVNHGHVFRFLTKPCPPEILTDAIELALEHYRETHEKELLFDRTSAKARNLAHKLTYQSKHDLLTGLANRQTLESRLDVILEGIQQKPNEHTLCYLDIDHFHLVNNACGPAAGDELLRQIANLLTQNRRHGDLTARLAGDRFCILLIDCQLDAAHGVVTELLETLQQHHFQWEGQPFSIRASIGVVAINKLSKSIAGIFSQAETACNVAKDSGRNRIHFSSEQDHELTGRLDEMQWAGRIQKALEEKRFRLYYQPIVPLASTDDEGEHYELLVRMQEDDGEIVAPGVFMPAVENYHLSTRLDCWVIETANKWLEEHPAALQQLGLCSINLSGHSLGNQEVLHCIQNTFASSSVPTHKICFEVTETVAIARMNTAVDFIKVLKSDGFRFALDDFGSGLSSFGYLKNLPVDFLKIDGMFVKNMDSDEFDYAIVKSIGEIGRVMGKKIIAEYVENNIILEHLRQLGIDYAQGYVIAKPQPLDELRNL